MREIGSFLILLFCTTFSFAKEVKESIPRVQGFEVISDEFDAKIPKGTYALEGQIFDLLTNKLLKKVTIQVVDGDKSTSIDGNFKMSIPFGKTFVAFDKSKYQRSYFEYYEVKEQHRIKVKILMNKAGKVPQIAEEKPVIYAYSEEELKFEIKLKQKGELSFVYPAFQEEGVWKMTLKNKELTNEKGLSFPYLFWESQRDLDFGFLKQDEVVLGKIIAKKDVIHFLDSTLSYLNLNAKEKMDFITYWGPKLVSNKFNFVQFVLQEECSLFADYEISPKPDVFNRLYLVFTGFETYPTQLKSTPQTLIPFERKGFHLLEWGGVAYPATYFNTDIE